MRFPALFLAFAVAATLSAGPLEPSERERVLTELQTSRGQLLDAITGLSQAQWTYKAAPDRWSVAEVSEHIIAAENYIGGLVRNRMMASPADPAKAEKRQAGIFKMDEIFLAKLRDRSQKASAPGEIVPQGIYKTPEAAINAFRAARENTLDYVRTTKDDLRDHFATPFPGFEMDGVQGLLMIAGHNERHVLQIKEVQKSPGYPSTK